MIIEFHKNFVKQFSKLQKQEQVTVVQTLKLFEKDPFNLKLRNHRLKGKYSNFRSISASGDLRLHYFEEDDKITVLFVELGSHSQLY
jgi:addiction module RelE/StbE family toxin